MANTLATATDQEPPADFRTLEAAITARYRQLSPRLQQIASYALAHPNDMALETVASIAERAGVQPSALIRFAKAFNFDGFSPMQQVFQTRLVERASSYSERLRDLGELGSETAAPGTILAHFVVAGEQALAHLRDEIDPQQLEAFVDRLDRSNEIVVVAQRRAFPVASYLAYALGHMGRRVRLIDDVGGMARQQAAGLRQGDVVLAISFTPYASLTTDVARLAHAAGVDVLGITDSPLAPLAQFSQEILLVQDAEVKSFRSLSATMCLAITLVVSLGYRETHRPTAPPGGDRG